MNTFISILRGWALLAALATTPLLISCSQNGYDSQREWRLRQCEKLLYAEEVKRCKADTPHYIE